MRGGGVLTATVASAASPETAYAAAAGTWKQSNGKWWYAYSNGGYATGWQTISGKNYYFNTQGYMMTGLTKIGSYRYYFGTDGVMRTGWQTISGKKYYFSTANGRAASGLVKLGNYRYYFGPSSNAMATGWQKISGKNYYFSSSTGRAASGLVKIGNYRYYFGPSSNVMATGWQKINGAQYYFSSVNGRAASGFVTIGGSKYYFGSSTNKMASGWVNLGINTYYFQSGVGKLVTNQWVGDRYVDSQGIWSNVTGEWHVAGTFSGPNFNPGSLPHEYSCMQVNSSTYTWYVEGAGTMYGTCEVYEIGSDSKDYLFYASDGSKAMGRVKNDGTMIFVTASGGGVLFERAWSGHYQSDSIAAQNDEMYAEIENMPEEVLNDAEPGIMDDVIASLVSAQ